MTEFERAQNAHAAVFAMVTAALTIENVDLETILADYVNESETPGRVLADIAHAAVWHAAGALLTYSEGDRDRALGLVQQGAYAQAMKQEAS